MNCYNHSDKNAVVKNFIIRKIQEMRKLILNTNKMQTENNFLINHKNMNNIKIDYELKEGYEHIIKLSEKMNKNFISLNELEKIIVEVDAVSDNLLKNIKNMGRRVDEYDRE